MERICGIVPWDHVWLANHKQKARDYLAAPDFLKWKADPGIALVSYALLQRRFGWGCIASCLTACTTCVASNADTQAKMDAWVQQLSLCCGANLCAFYRAWGMPLTAACAEDAAVAALPEWGADVLALMD